MLLAMRSGEIQGTFKVPFPQIAQYKQLPGVNVQTASAETPGYLSLDVSDPPFSDIHVRRAIAYAVNQAGMVHAVLNGYGSPAPTMPPPQQWGDVMSPSKVAAFYKTIPKYPFNLAKAKAELAKSSVPHGFTANITYPNSSPELGEALQILAQDLKQIGITLNVKEIPHSQWVNVFYVHHNPLGPQVGEWTPDYPGPRRRAISALPERQRSAELVQHRELQEQADGCAHCSAEQLGQTGRAGGRDREGAQARRS